MLNRQSLLMTVKSSMVRYSDVTVAGAVIMMVVMMVIPLPPMLLDVLLAFNLSLALVILLVAMYALHPLDFSIFPSLLLLTTLFRLALNVSSTRLILLHGYAGQIIQQFGLFVVGGNPVVGFVVFLILVVIQFAVIVKGSERVAEVAARFTLDAMPGKQMSIDADLNSGLITEQDARLRRREIEREADFYGAMDGASKFVKGDAIAAIIITVINVVGGFIVGTAGMGLSWSESLQRFTLLTVGDGLVSQIPALLISTATGIVVTRAASEGNLGQDLLGQIFTQPRVLTIAAVVLGGFGLIPGLPALPFMILAAVFGTSAYSLHRSAAGRSREVEVPAAERAGGGPESMNALLEVDPLEIELGYGLLPLADQQQGGDLMNRVAVIRRQTALDLGLILPLVRVRDNLQLPPKKYVVKLRGAEIGSGELLVDHFLAMDPGTADGAVEGIETTEPAFGLPARWVSAQNREEAELAGYTVVDPPSVLATHLTELIKRHAHELLGRQEVKGLLDNLKATTPAVIEELVPKLLTLGEVQKVLQNLLREGVSIRDLVTILEALADHATHTKDPGALTEYARQALGRTFTRRLPIRNGRLEAITLDPGLEQELASAVAQGEPGGYVAIDPNLVEELMDGFRSECRRLLSKGLQPVVICSPLVRFYLKRLTERVLPTLEFFSYSELAPDVQVVSIGTVSERTGGVRR